MNLSIHNYRKGLERYVRKIDILEDNDKSIVLSFINALNISGIGLAKQINYAQLSYEILKIADDKEYIARLLKYINTLEDNAEEKEKEIFKNIRKFISDNMYSDRLIVFGAKPYTDKQFLIDAYEELRKNRGAQLIAHNLTVPGDILRIQNNDELYDIMIAYLNDIGNTRVIIDYPLRTMLDFNKNELNFKEDTYPINVILKGQAELRYVKHLPLPLCIGKDTFAGIGFENKALFVKSKELANLAEEYFNLLWNSEHEEIRYIKREIANVKADEDLNAFIRKTLLELTKHRQN